MQCRCVCPGTLWKALAVQRYQDHPVSIRTGCSQSFRTDTQPESLYLYSWQSKCTVNTTYLLGVQWITSPFYC